MGSVIQFNRRRVSRRLVPKLRADAESHESLRALYVLIGGFFGTALIMCAAVVVTISSTWTDVIAISSFIFVFALVKIIIANALMYVMIRADDETMRAEMAPKAGAVFVRKPPLYRKTPPSPKGGRKPVKPGAIRLAVLARNPQPRAPGGR